MWTDTVGPTAIKFLQSDRLGKQYENDVFVSDVTQGNIYRFDLTNNRKGLKVDGPLADEYRIMPQKIRIYFLEMGLVEYLISKSDLMMAISILFRWDMVAYIE